MTNWETVADRVLAGGRPTRAEALAALALPDDEVPALLAAAHRVRLARFGHRVRVHVLRNAKSGACPEDCGFCSQSAHSDGEVAVYGLVHADSIVEGARQARAAGAVEYCIVIARRGPSPRDLDTICEAVARIKREVRIGVCTSLGLLTPEGAGRLAAAGVNRYNHNLETSERFFGQVCTTHSWQDRVRTIRLAREAGMEVCCGGIVGMGESNEDRVDLAFALSDLQAESVPVNFLDPRPGTAMADRPRSTPWQCLAILALFRLTIPNADIRAAGGREASLRSLQPMALLAATSIFTGGYLTTGGNAAAQDMEMVRDMGMTIEDASVYDAAPA